MSSTNTTNKRFVEIPVTTAEEPFIKFWIDRGGKLYFGITNDWWGGKDNGFITSDGDEGNSCKPDDIIAYLEASLKRKKERIEKEVERLQCELVQLSTTLKQ